MSFTYIASPYSHEDAAIREERFNNVSKFTAMLVKSGVIAYSPIAHSHPLAVKYNIRGDFGFWAHQNYGMLSKASNMIVLCLDGWKDSKGVQAEIAFAEQCGIDIEYVDGEQ